MPVLLKVVTTSTFPDWEAMEDFIRASAGFEVHQAVELLEERSLIVKEDRDMVAVGTIEPTVSMFTIEEKK